DRTVVTVGVPPPKQTRWQVDPFGDLGAHEFLIQQSQRLVVQVGVHVALLTQEGDQLVGAPVGPVVEGEKHIGAVREQVQRLVQVARPDACVAYGSSS